MDYNVIYHLDGGTNANTNPSVFNKEQSNILLANPTKDNYKFIGWYSEQAFTNKVSSINTQTESNIDLYAKWEENTTPIAQYYSISYRLNGGKNSNNNPVRFNETTNTIELENPDKASATFQGWFSEDGFENQVTEIDTVNTKQNLHLYAKWLNGVQETIYDLDLGIGSEHIIYQVSDTHVNACNDDYSKKQESGRISGRVNFANSFGEKYNVANLPTVTLDILNNFVSYINAQQPDVVCYTGDIMDYYSKANYEVINTALSNNTRPFVYAPGNHEDPSAVLEGMVGVDTIEFTVREFEDFEIISMDNSSNNGNEDYYFTENQYQLLLAETLKNKPIIIAEHVPLLTEYNCESRLEKCGSYYFIDRNGCDLTSQKVVDLICNNDNIKLVLCGHIHGGTQTKLTPTKYQISCASGLIGIINKITIH